MGPLKCICNLNGTRLRVHNTTIMCMYPVEYNDKTMNDYYGTIKRLTAKIDQLLDRRVGDRKVAHSQFDSQTSDAWLFSQDKHFTLMFRRSQKVHPL